MYVSVSIFESVYIFVSVSVSVSASVSVSVSVSLCIAVTVYLSVTVSVSVFVFIFANVCISFFAHTPLDEHPPPAQAEDVKAFFTKYILPQSGLFYRTRSASFVLYTVNLFLF